MMNKTHLPKYYAKFVQELPSLEGKTVAITGTTSGVGFHAAAGVIKKKGTALFLVNRDSKRSINALEKLVKIGKDNESPTEVIKIDCDLADFESVTNGAKQLNEAAERFGGLNIVANNAGISSFPDDRTKDGYDIQIQVNHLGQYLFSKLVMPSLIAKYNAGEECRIVQQSSGGRIGFNTGIKKKYFQKSAPNKLGGNGFFACFNRYRMTKLANSTFAMALAKEIEKKENLDSTRFKSIVTEPGFSMTSLSSNLFASHKDKGFFHRTKMNIMGSLLMGYFSRVTKSQAPEDGAMPLLQGMLGSDVDNGDFYVPAEKSVGLPVKSVSKTKAIENSVLDEKLTLNENHQKAIWEVSEAELGSFFELAELN